MAKPGKQVFFKQETILGGSGEVLGSHTTIVHTDNGEPSFIKMYLDDIGKLSDLSKTNINVLHELLKLMDYNNSIILNGQIKRGICRRLDIWYSRFSATPKEGVNTIDQALLALVNAGVLFRLGTGTFKANPFLFAKGAWKDIKEIRLQITYDAEKGRFLNANIEK